MKKILGKALEERGQGAFGDKPYDKGAMTACEAGKAGARSDSAFFLFQKRSLFVFLSSHTSSFLLIINEKSHTKTWQQPKPLPCFPMYGNLLII